MIKEKVFAVKQALCAKRRKELIQRITLAELHVVKLLEENKLKFIFQKGFISGKNFCIVDFYLPKPYRICIEIDGSYHSLPKQQVRDKNKDFYLQKQRGFKVIHITNEAVLNMNSKQLMSKIKYLKNNA